jgi:TetR/AcrR family transcriptional regulator of autoinduction and epiphytic fitness
VTTALPRARAASDGVAEDGRTARSRRTRTAVVDALLALQEEGNLAPTAQQVAARAGVGLRTVFGHFSDMETLWAEAGQRELAKLEQLADPIDRDRPLLERVQLFATSRARVLEALLPVMRAARLREPTSPQLMANRALFIRVGEDEVRHVFGAELARLDDGGRRRLLDALYVAAAGPAWEVLRHDRGLDQDAARAVLEFTLLALLAPTPFEENAQ